MNCWHANQRPNSKHNETCKNPRDASAKHVDGRGAKSKLREYGRPVSQTAERRGLIDRLGNDNCVARVNWLAIEFVIRPDGMLKVLSTDYRAIGTNDEDLATICVSIRTTRIAQVITSMLAR